MKIMAKDELRAEDFVKHVDNGEVFIHPTDTIYGIGCDASNESAVERLREIKMRDAKPFSIIAPSKEWIYSNCIVLEETEKWMEKLPGKYTLILSTKQGSVARNVSGLDSIGIRIPNHWFSELVAGVGKPVVTTSVNKAGCPFMTSLSDLDADIGASVDFIVYEGEKRENPSTIVDLRDETPKLTQR